jgi:hypothetical protein
MMLKITPLLLGVAAGMACAALPARAADTPGCDRACQIGVLDQVLEAFAARDARRAPLTATVRYTENGQVLAPGDGFWGTADGIGTYRHYFADPASGHAAFIGTMRENGDPVIVTLRLRITPERQVSEIEAIVSRTDAASGPMAQGPAAMDRLGKPNPIWDSPIPPRERMSRDALIAVANTYFTGLQGNDGKGDYRFTDDCYRLENGVQSTGPSPISLSNPPPRKAGAPPSFAGPTPDWGRLGCKAQFELGWMRFVDRIRERRFLVVDPEYGTVFTMVFFDHSGTIHDFEMANGDRIVGTGLQEPYTWELGEAFRIEKGKIRLIEAAMTRAPYGMGSNWPAQQPWPDGALGTQGY